MIAPRDPWRPAPDPAEIRRLRLAIEASGEIVFTTDPDGTFTYVNPEFERAYGYQASEVVGRVTPRILKSGTTEPTAYVSFWTELLQGHAVRREFVNRTKQGAFINIEASANPIIGEDRELLGFLTVQRDITAAKQLEVELRESERRYRTLADAAQDSIFIINRDGQVEYANDAAEKWFGLGRSAVVGRRLHDLFPAETADRMWRLLSTVFSTAKRQLFEESWPSLKGEIWLESWIVPMELDGHGVRTVMGVARDVTERKVLQREFLQAQKMEAVGRLAGGIAHDFNNLLTAILGYSELLLERVSEAPHMQADLEEIRKAGERASRLTRQLLAYSRKQPMTPQVVDMSVLLGDLQKMLGRMLREDIRLSAQSAPDLPTVVADPSQIEQVILNLAVNGRDAMPKGGELRVTIEAVSLDEQFVRKHAGAKPGDYVALAVQDTGCGIAPDVLGRVFEPFFTTKPLGQGTGLGLSTVYGIVKQNAGYVNIDSSPGEGTTVTVFWPVHGGGAATTATAEAVRGARPGSEMILLVEDDPAIRALMCKTLESYGYGVLDTEDVGAAERLAVTYKGHIDLLLSDVIMPGLNGPDLAQRVLAHRPDIRVLYVSGFPNSLLPAQDPTRRRLAFLAKPFTPQALAGKVRECLDW